LDAEPRIGRFRNGELTCRGPVNADVRRPTNPEGRTGDGNAIAMKKIDDLAAAITPPSEPRVTLADDDWLVVYVRLGTRLPQDFVQFHRVYGEGYFCSVSHPNSANLSIYGGGTFEPILKSVPRRLSELRIEKEKRPRSVPASLYWEPGGLLPWGRTTNGTDLCWKVQGELVDNWKVVALRTASKTSETYDVSMTVFLRGIIDRTITCPLLPKGFPGEKGVVWKVWPYGPSKAD
jgi:hypothetical protein